MATLVYNPITRLAFRGLVTYAYVHLALDAVQGAVKISRHLKSRISR
jgi:hypothetical protein